MTADQLIDQAYRICGANLAAGRRFGDTTSQKVEALAVLNNLMGTYRIMAGTWYEIQTNVHTLTPLLNPHSIGTGGNFNQDRPVKIIEAYLRYTPAAQPVDLKMIQLTVEQYAEISIKTVNSQLPQWFYYDAAYSSNTNPLGNVYLWMIPNAAYQIVLYTPKILTEPAALSTDLLLPPGYPRMLAYNLAVEMVPLFRKRYNDPRADQAMYRGAQESLYWVKVNNARPLDMQSDLATLNYTGGVWDFRTGDYRFN